jgi:hypothetical protein
MKPDDIVKGRFNTMINKDIRQKIEGIYKKVGKEKELEVMFFNYKMNENMMNFEQYLKMLEYMNYRSKGKT